MKYEVKIIDLFKMDNSYYTRILILQWVSENKLIEGE